MSQKRNETEAQIAARVVEHMRSDGWDVFQEVEVGTGGPRADLVCEQAGHIHIIEVKRSASVALITQAVRWRMRHAANFVSIAAPLPSGKSRADPIFLCATRGIGVLDVRLDRVAEVSAPGLEPDMRHEWVLLDEHREGFASAGSQGGGYVTTFALTAEKVREFVASHPGCPVDEIVDAIDHHYTSKKSAIGALTKLLRKGVVQGLMVKRSRGKFLVYQTGVAS